MRRSTRSSPAAGSPAGAGARGTPPRRRRHEHLDPGGSVRSIPTSCSTIRHASAGVRRSARCQAATTARSRWREGAELPQLVQPRVRCPGRRIGAPRVLARSAPPPAARTRPWPPAGRRARRRPAASRAPMSRPGRRAAPGWRSRRRRRADRRSASVAASSWATPASVEHAGPVAEEVGEPRVVDHARMRARRRHDSRAGRPVDGEAFVHNSRLGSGRGRLVPHRRGRRAARRQRRHRPPLDRQRPAAGAPRGRAARRRSTAPISPGSPRSCTRRPSRGDPLVVGPQPADRHRHPRRPRHRHGAGGDPGRARSGWCR